jgi:hypothetical protein
VEEVGDGHPEVLVHPDLPAAARRHHHHPPSVAALRAAVPPRGRLAARQLRQQVRAGVPHRPGLGPTRRAGDADVVVHLLLGRVAPAAAPGRRVAPQGRRPGPGHGHGHVPAEEVLVGPAGEPGLGPDADAAPRAAGAAGAAGWDPAPHVDVRVLAGADDVAAVRGVGRGDLAAGVLEPWQEETRVPFGLWSLCMAFLVR